MKTIKIETEFLTDTQIMRKVLPLVKKWIAAHDLKNVTCQFIRGNYYLTNHLGYMLTAQTILESATGLKFQAKTDSICKLGNTEQPTGTATYFAQSENLKEFYTFRATSMEDARHWVINHLDLSLNFKIGIVTPEMMPDNLNQFINTSVNY